MDAFDRGKVSRKRWRCKDWETTPVADVDRMYGLSTDRVCLSYFSLLISGVF